MQPLYRRILGPAYDTLPAAVQRLHEATSETRWVGSCCVTRGKGSLIGLLCAAARIPAETQSAAPDFGLAIRPTRTGERWARSFVGRQPFVSHQWAQTGWLCERILVMTLTFKVDAKPDGLRLVLTRCHLFGVPLPQALHPIIQTLESERNGVVCFDVTAKLPTGHLIVHYRGTLSRLTP